MKLSEALDISIYVKNPEWMNGSVMKYIIDADMLYELKTGTLGGLPDSDSDGWVPCFSDGEPSV